MTEVSSPLPVTVLGTGIIGAAIARNLARQGFGVRAWNRSAEKAASLAVDGITPFKNITDAVRGAAIIITSLTDERAVSQTLAAALPDIPKGAIWVQLSTVGVEATNTFIRFADENGLIFYDAPVQGTRQPAEQGKLVILASGPTENRETVQSVFDAIGQRTIWVSDTAGASSRLKLALNAYVFALTHGIAETLLIARTLGIDPSFVIEAVRGGPLDSGYFQGKGAAMLNNDFTTNFSIENGVKDAGLVLDALKGTALRADLAEAGLIRFQRAANDGYGSKDIAASFLV